MTNPEFPTRRDSAVQWCAMQTAALLLLTAARTNGTLAQRPYDAACVAAGFLPLAIYWICAGSCASPPVLVLYVSTVTIMIAGDVIGPCTLPPFVAAGDACREWPPVIAFGLGVVITAWAHLQLFLGNDVGRMWSIYMRSAVSAGALDYAASRVLGRSSALALVGSLQNTWLMQGAGLGVIAALGEPIGVVNTRAQLGAQNQRRRRR